MRTAIAFPEDEGKDKKVIAFVTSKESYDKKQMEEFLKQNYNKWKNNLK